MSLFIGIDPGAGGAIAFLRGTQVKVYDCPTFKLAINKGMRKEPDVSGMLELFYKHCEVDSNPQAILEKVHGMPKMGGASMFSFGKNFGQWQTLLIALKIPFQEIAPQRWKRAMFDSKDKSKDGARKLAMFLFPHDHDAFKRKCDDGRAEAALMALYGRRMAGGE